MRRLLAGVVAAVGLLVMTSSGAEAQRERSPGTFGRGLGEWGRLMGFPDVHRELKLSDEDAAKIKELLEKYRAPGFGSVITDEFRQLPAEEKQKRLDDYRKQLDDASKKVEETLKSQLTAEQFQRLSELRLQHIGPRSLARDEIAQSLQLTAEQRTKIKPLIEQMSPSTATRGESRDEARERRKKLNAEILAVLTTEQSVAWEKLQGSKFNGLPVSRGTP